MDSSLPIGIFDSGVGGLTVLSAIRQVLPQENLLYLGDTARLPYGTKGTDTIRRYALQATEKLMERGVKALVVACNTATAAALPALQAAYKTIPVIGVVAPGAQAAVAASKSGHILVLATESTIRNGAYTSAITSLRPDAHVTGLACSLFVALVEEGWAHRPGSTAEQSIAVHIAKEYLQAIFCAEAIGTSSFGQKNVFPAVPDCIVLGCTHFPPLAPAIASIAGEHVIIVDSAITTAKAVQDALHAMGLIRNAPHEGFLQLLTTDSPERFARVGSFFLSQPIGIPDVELIAL